MQRVEAFFGLTVGFAAGCIGHGGVSYSSNGYGERAILGEAEDRSSKVARFCYAVDTGITGRVAR